MGEHWSTILANVVTSLGILSFFVFYIAHQQSENQFRFTVMLSCIDRFQQLSPLLRDDNDNLNRLKKYVDLTNEEFFYFQRKYIPKEVIIEWMDSIVDLFPIYQEGCEVPLNYQSAVAKQIHDNGLLKAYPRLVRAFTVKKELELFDKVTVIHAIALNLGVKLRARHFRKALFTKTAS